jgi:hypothetical protein
MSGLSEVSVLIGQRAADLEKAREVFTAEIRNFATGVLAGVRRVRQDPWVTPRLRIDVPREIETEAKATSALSSQYAVARANLRFKRGTNFMMIAEVRFGIEYDEGTDQFAWQVTVIPAARYQRIDDQLWAHWKSAPRENAPPGAVHQDKSNTVRFVSRPIALDLTPEMAFNDVKMILEFIISADVPLAAAVGVEPGLGEEG